jgi:hypothetical protein
MERAGKPALFLFSLISAVNLATVPDLDDVDRPPLIINAVNDTVVAHPNSKAGARARKLLRTGATGVFG